MLSAHPLCQRCINPNGALPHSTSGCAALQHGPTGCKQGREHAERGARRPGRRVGDALLRDAAAQARHQGSGRGGGGVVGVRGRQRRRPRRLQRRGLPGTRRLERRGHATQHRPPPPSPPLAARGLLLRRLVPDHQPAGATPLPPPHMHACAVLVLSRVAQRRAGCFAPHVCQAEGSPALPHRRSSACSQGKPGQPRHPRCALLTGATAAAPVAAVPAPAHKVHRAGAGDDSWTPWTLSQVVFRSRLRLVVTVTVLSGQQVGSPGSGLPHLGAGRACQTVSQGADRAGPGRERDDRRLRGAAPEGGGCVGEAGAVPPDVPHVAAHAGRAALAPPGAVARPVHAARGASATSRGGDCRFILVPLEHRAGAAHAPARCTRGLGPLPALPQRPPEVLLNRSDGAGAVAGLARRVRPLPRARS